MSLSSRGPEDTCFEFGVFPAILSFPLDYPLSPPKMRFTCEMFHPNSKCFGGRRAVSGRGPGIVYVHMGRGVSGWQTSENVFHGLSFSTSVVVVLTSQFHFRRRV